MAIKEVWIGWLSSCVEAYNMSIYSFMAPLIAPYLFQEQELFYSYALVFLGSCFLYPAGAIYYGLMGDRYGRQRTCIYATLGLGIATGLMGLIPLKDGWIYFLLLIGAQHFFSGGEYHGSIVFTLEHGVQKQKGFMSGLSCLFAVFGLVLANGLSSIASLSLQDYVIHGCFLLGALGGIISYILKNYCQETPAYCSLKESTKGVQWSTFIRAEWPKIMTVVLVFSFFLVSYHFIFIFLPLINSSSDHFSTFKSLLAYGACLVISGVIADKIGIQRTIKLGIALFSALIIPITYLSSNLLLTQMVLTPCACLVIGPIHSWALEQFEISKRCRGIFLSSAIATSLFGGSTVPLCLMIFENFESLVLCSLYPLMIGFVTFLSITQPKKVYEIY